MAIRANGEEMGGETLDDNALTNALVLDVDARLSGTGIRMVACAVSRSKHGKEVHASILKKPAVSHDDCVLATGHIQEALRAHGDDPDGFTISVSSPGLTRVLRTEREYALFVGAPVIVFLTPEGEALMQCAEVTGTIEGYADDTATIRRADGTAATLPRTAVRSMKLHYDI